MPAEEFHESHRNAWELDAADETRATIHESWFRTDTADYWRHARMYEPAGAFLHRPGLSWLTVGDGRFGLDSIRIRKLGFESALPTDIGDALLRKAKADGLISEYAVENAEKLSFADDSFDLVFCKESYHHFPRAPLALYEMLRVARHAVVLVEPRDYVIDHGPARLVGPVGIAREFAAWLRNRLGIGGAPVAARSRYISGDAPHYEESGNYMYAISSREVEKLALGLNLPAIAVKGLNDIYLQGGETEPASDGSVLFEKMKQDIAAADRQTRTGLGSTSLLMAIIFKTPPEAFTKNYLTERSWCFTELPRNPYAR